MLNFFYPKLAVMNIWKNRRIYIPYILTCIFNIAMFYMMFYMCANPDLSTVPGSDALTMVLFLGMVVIGIFSLIFLCYSNSFLIKRRKKEFGLYNVLGMEKRHIRKTLCWEMFFVILISFFTGLLLGIVGSKLMFLLLLQILHVPAKFGFIISMDALGGTMGWFLGIFALTLVLNMWQIHLANPIELLRGGNTGEREPKSKWLLVLIGTVCLGGGYGIALVTKNPLEALLLFFVAVILVMIGTYCLFTAGSIAVLKMLRWNKKFYYQTSHFTSISGMIYRMKQNAVGLANICILSTGVLIMISGTVSMYAGLDDIMDTRYPYDVEYAFWGEGRREAGEGLRAYLEETAAGKGMEISQSRYFGSLEFTAVGQGGDLRLLDPYSDEIQNYTNQELVTISAMTLEDYNRIQGTEKTLKDGEALLYVIKGKGDFPVLSIGEKAFQIKEEVDDCPYRSELTAYVGGSYFLVLKDDRALEELEAYQAETYLNAGSNICEVLQLNLAGSEEEKKSLQEKLAPEISSFLEETCAGKASYQEDYKQMQYQESYSLYGGFYFLGIFLGLLFLMGTTLIIYYKQVSEGYDDRERFEIMQKVGMSKREVRRSIKSQVITVFFLPLLMAWVHIAFAFPMVSRLLSTLNMYNVKLFALCTVITAAAFALVYAAIYGVTARMYYKIVER